MTRPTISDVASQAGVSRGTVSRVLNGSPRVSPEARKAVEQAIRATRYRTNPHARSLASGRNNTVAVLLTQPQSELFEDPTFSLLLQGVSNGLAGSDITLVLLLAGNSEERRRTAKFLDTRYLDGVVHLSPHIDDPMLDALLAADMPVVLCGEPPVGYADKRLWSVTITDRLGAAAATRHLMARGAKQIGLVAGPEDAPGSVERLGGYREALADRFDPGLVAHGDYGRESGRRAFEALHQLYPDLDAVFCASDRMAAGVYDAARDLGLRIPDDLRVVGFDDHTIASELTPQLTTVRQPMRELGRAAVHMLDQATRGENPGHRIFPTELVIRASS